MRICWLPYGKKGWRLYDLEKNKFVVSRDVVFQETVFPFATDNTSSPIVSPSMLPPFTIFHDEDWIPLQPAVSLTSPVDTPVSTSPPSLSPLPLTQTPAPISTSPLVSLISSSNSSQSSPTTHVPSSSSSSQTTPPSSPE